MHGRGKLTKNVNKNNVIKVIKSGKCVILTAQLNEEGMEELECFRHVGTDRNSDRRMEINWKHRLG